MSQRLSQEWQEPHPTIEYKSWTSVEINSCVEKQNPIHKAKSMEKVVKHTPLDMAGIDNEQTQSAMTV